MAYNYTDLTVTMAVAPKWLADCESVYVSIESVDKGTTEVETTSFNRVTGTIVANFPQEETAKLGGTSYIQCNGFLHGARWATRKKRVFIGINAIGRILPDEQTE